MDEASLLSETRRAYDIVAADYAVTDQDGLTGRPFDRALLALFAELVQAAGGRTVTAQLNGYLGARVPRTAGVVW